MIPAAETLAVVVEHPEAPRATMTRMMLGPLARHPAPHEVLVVDRATGKLVIRVPVNGPSAQADALAALMRADLENHDERGFLKRHGRAHRHR